MQSLSTFIRISGFIPEFKKSSLINDNGNIIVYSEESKQSDMQANKYGFFQIYFGDLRVNVPLGKFGHFYYNLSLETGFLALKLAQNCYIGKYKYMLFLKTDILILNWVPISFFYNHPIPERLSSQSILPNSLVNWEQFGSTNQAYVQKKKQFSIFFS